MSSEHQPPESMQTITWGYYEIECVRNFSSTLPKAD